MKIPINGVISQSMATKKRRIKTNKAKSPDRIMIHCTTAVKRDAVRREVIGGTEFIFVSSSTLPDDIVMNGILYPAKEIAAGFGTLEKTHAPIEHPTDSDGNFISAADPEAIPNFYAGASNVNVRQEDGRVHIDKKINVVEANKSDRGRHMLDRIEEIETSDKARPIHTSVGVYLSVNELEKPIKQVNGPSAGQEYWGIAEDLVFDHDAFLFNSVGAAQPHQGVGVAVNKDGKELRVDTFTLDAIAANNSDKKFDRLSALTCNLLQSEEMDAVREVLEKGPFDVSWIEDFAVEGSEQLVIFWSSDSLFKVSFVIDEQGIATIVGIPLPVERTVTFPVKTNHSEGDAMKELMLAALAAAGIAVNADISDDDLLAQYNELQASQSKNDGNGTNDDTGIAEVVANAVTTATKPLVDQIAGLEAKVNSADEAELTNLATFVANSGKYDPLDVDGAKKLGVDTLKGMAATCQPAYGLSPVLNTNQGADESFSAPAEMPK